MDQEAQELENSTKAATKISSDEKHLTQSETKTSTTEDESVGKQESKVPPAEVKNSARGGSEISDDDTVRKVIQQEKEAVEANKQDDLDKALSLTAKTIAALKNLPCDPTGNNPNQLPCNEPIANQPCTSDAGDLNQLPCAGTPTSNTNALIHASQMATTKQTPDQAAHFYDTECMADDDVIGLCDEEEDN